MNLLFNTTSSVGNTDLKVLLGFIDADLKIQNLKPDLITATNDVINLVGEKVYNIAFAKYELVDQTPADKALIYAIQYPIAINAYRMYAPSNDVSHTNDGRKMRQDDAVKMPFEWMLDRDNAALEKRYYRALDDLVRLLDRSKVDVETEATLYTVWRNSTSYQLVHKLFISTVPEFDEIFPINSRLLLIKLAPGISNCERYEIVPRIGLLRATLLKEANNTDQAEPADVELIRLIKEACVAYSFYWAMPRLSVQLYPEGVLQHVTSDGATTRGARPTMGTETQEAAQAWKKDFDRIIISIEELLKPIIVVDPNLRDCEAPKPLCGDRYFSI